MFNQDSLAILYVKVFENGDKTAICIVIPRNKKSLHPRRVATLIEQSSANIRLYAFIFLRGHLPTEC